MRLPVLPRPVWLVVALLGVLLAVSACGGGAEPTATPPPAEPTATTAPVAQAPAATPVPPATNTLLPLTEVPAVAATELVPPTSTPVPTEEPAPAEPPAALATVGQTDQGLYFVGSPDPAALAVIDYSDFL